ncbi:TPA: helix-turn-helix transcriptional regulator [Pseudomonas aeruginosa]|uniref:helix-turn-helix transcriptional regulator n=1 Tax=Pseudomonas aeruginosa TaxID=287 RepID=UPI000F5215F3|nr:LuxR C-terminal-related transcriptional regulator [Pseudomonas aeruginosa]EKU1307228.1 response regulator transcription factor [Pseudomonas aeruginosa]EKU1941912.1 response regulator transcription factor [Pseudomonas aeruginosa]RQB38501.1 helix-turn-helix transcriptional regulator [Pseudomonas aeruginosa]HBO6141096.1 response regulator transcription factor [Pseudomonas aeruginosa]HBP5273495.1 response regulator transcription factor [Pseudomonas aeruginosa]
MTLLDIEKLLDMTHHMSVHIPIELIISWEQSEEAWSVKDNCLNFVYVNRRYTELITPRFGQKNSLLSPFSASIEEHDKLVIQTGKRIEALALLRPDDHPAPSCLYFERMPLYDRRGNRTGVIAHAKTLTSVAPRGFIATDGIGTFTFTPPSELFTSREWDVIYLLLSGLSEKEIAEQISRSLSTVKFHKSNIFQKVGCSCIGAFKALARQKKWNFYIPPTFASAKYIINH